MADGSIQVVVRTRPLNAREAEGGDELAFVSEGDTIMQSVFGATGSSGVDPARSQTSFTFDNLYGPEDETEALYAQAVRPIVLAAVNGYHSSVFAYGQTSTGKTFTMQGTCVCTMVVFSCVCLCVCVGQPVARYVWSVHIPFA